MAFLSKDNQPADDVAMAIFYALMNPAILDTKWDVVRLPRNVACINEFGCTLDSLYAKDNQNTIDLFLQMAGLDGYHEYIIHAPGKILFTNIPNAQIIANTVFMRLKKTDLYRTSARDIIIKYQ
jgi:hypothetical protein